MRKRLEHFTPLKALIVFAATAGFAASARLAHAEKSPAAWDDGIRYVGETGGGDDGDGAFDFPIDIAIGPGDIVFVTDHYNDRIQEFTSEGVWRRNIPVHPAPGGIAISPSGRLYVSHFAAGGRDKDKKIEDHICVYDPDGSPVLQWGRRGDANGEFNCPGGLAVAKDGTVFVADQTNHRVQVFDADGGFLRKWGEYGDGLGQFGGGDAVYSRTGGPQFIAIDPEGNVWTTESMSDRIQKFTPNGRLLLAWGDAADKPGGLGGRFCFPAGSKARLHGPISLAFGPQGGLWITTAGGRVQEFTPEGVFIRGLVGEQGSSPGQFRAPHGLAFDSTGRLHVVDAFNQRVQRFEIDPPRS